MTSRAVDASGSWPALPLAQWQDTRDTLHLWTQVVGKTRLALAPRVNHWWNVPLYVDTAGLSTSLMPLPGGDGLEVSFDVTADRLLLRTASGGRAQVELYPRSVADFFGEYLARLDELSVNVEINPMPAEISDAVPFDVDTADRAYDGQSARRFWRSLVAAHGVLSQFRGEYRGKASPVHFFWGAFDLATTRFSGRSAPVHPGGVPHCPDWVMVEAYDQEVSSCGYWPGGADEGVFYAYAYPEPPGYRDEDPGTPAARFDAALGEFVLPYAAVRTADDPAQKLLDFLHACDAAARRLGGWLETAR